MDRFIVDFMLVNITSKMQFKIQYGQIYSNMLDKYYNGLSIFKIQYGQIYRFVRELLLIFSEYLKSNMDRFIG